MFQRYRTNNDAPTSVSLEKKENKQNLKKERNI